MMNRKYGLIGFLFLLLVLFLVSHQLLLMGALIMAIAGRFVVVFHLERFLLLFLFAVLPLSVDLELMPGAKMNLPAEGLSILLFFTCLFNLLEVPFRDWPRIIKEVLSSLHGLSITFFLLVMLWATFYSTMFTVSIKFLIVNTLFVGVGFLYTYISLQKKHIQIKELLMAVTLGFSVVCIYALFNSIVLGIGRNVAPAIARPFFNDHTHFSATLMLILPLTVYLWKVECRPSLKRLYVFVIGLFVVCLISSFCRAAWLGALFMVFMYLIFYFRIKTPILLLCSVPLLVLFWLNQEALLNAFSINKNDSNRFQSTLGEQVMSVTNVTSDASNLERINRWKCALRMGNASPFWGFGPGTYQFQYFPFQYKYERTKISVNSPYIIKQGRGGTAHSEYLLSFAEEGYPGLLSWLLLVVSVCVLFFFTRSAGIDQEDLFLLQMVFLSFMGYFIHAFMNNFLNAVNFALYFWMLMAILVFLSSRYRSKKIDYTC